jgi:hypothetical protein
VAASLGEFLVPLIARCSTGGIAVTIYPKRKEGLALRLVRELDGQHADVTLRYGAIQTAQAEVLVESCVAEIGLSLLTTPKERPTPQPPLGPHGP